MTTLADCVANHLPQEQWGDGQHVAALIEAILVEARRAGASDVHLRPTATALEMDWRLDGVLQHVATLPGTIRANVVTRLKVLAGLLTYQTDRPQEGRLRTLKGEESAALAPGNEMRLSVVPTAFGEKAVIRLFVGSGKYRRLTDLALPGDTLAALTATLHETSGVLLVSGPAGSGKTTTVYAALRELSSEAIQGTNARSRRSLVTIEDPIEAILPETAQSQVRPAAHFGYTDGVKAILRQDPDVLLIGEIRDAETAGVVFQASLAGHLVLTTFHSGSAAETVSRLLDMGMEPYQLRSGLLAVFNQRLVRRLCDCAEWSDREEDRLGLPVERTRVERGCPKCEGTGYAGRLVLVEVLFPQRSDTSRAILERADSVEIGRRARAAGMISQEQRAAAAVETGLTSAAEIRRSFGFGR